MQLEWLQKMRLRLGNKIAKLMLNLGYADHLNLVVANNVINKGQDNTL